MTEENKNIKKFPNSGNIPKLRFSEFTEEWGTKTLGKIGEVVNGLTYSPNDIDEHGVLVLRSSNVQNRTITFTDNVFVKANNFNPVKENDILICVRNGSKNLIGKNALIKKQNEGLAFGAFMAIYRSEFNRFLFQWFDTKDYKDIVNKNLGATINSINGGDLKKFKVPFPSLKEQEKIASFLSLIDERILSQKKIIEDLQITKKEISLK
ncbi:restriction endonuclease subunit S, partial [Flavobacterium lindanitolerans]|uniref:restriction endonuclease subunit S n=1 Tax=Flavobacterium lindanitolerans TaxID=428988 RepID=UPI0027B9BFB2